MCVFSGCCAALVACWHCPIYGLCLGAALLSTGTSAGQLFWNCSPAPIPLWSKTSLLLHLPSIPPPSSSSVSASLRLFLLASLSLFSSTCACLSSLPPRAQIFLSTSAVFEDPPCFLCLGGAAVMITSYSLTAEKKIKESSAEKSRCLVGCLAVSDTVPCDMCNECVSAISLPCLTLRK